MPTTRASQTLPLLRKWTRVIRAVLRRVCALLQLPRLRAVRDPEMCACTRDMPVEACCTQLWTLPAQRCASPPTVELLKMREHAEASTSLCSTETRGVACLAGLPRLRTLSICCTDMNDSVLCSLGKCALLEKLDVSAPTYLTGTPRLAGVVTLEEPNPCDCSHIGRSATGLVRLPRPRVLSLRNTRVTSCCLVVLGESRSLVKLDLSSCRHISDITPVLGTATLCELNVLGCKNSRSTRHSLPRLPNLRSLSTGRVDTSKCERHVIKHTQGLTGLKLRRDDSRAVKSSLTERMQTLAELERDANKMRVILDRLFDLGHLRVLSLRCLVPSFSVRFLPKCASMVKLSLTQCRKPTDLRPLANVESLYELHLSCLKLRRKGVIGSPPLLRHLGVSRCDVANDAFSQIRESSTLECLGISDCKRIEDLSLIRKMGRLEELLLVGCENVCSGWECLLRLPPLRLACTPDVDLSSSFCSALRKKGVGLVNERAYCLERP
ncbi:hypothetical protein ERJ75_000343400 [Trypanosoma vivax]|nr:hypothetical protein ERJ75_000343400 [Trypanosoma vivax]